MSAWSIYTRVSYCVTLDNLYRVKLSLGLNPCNNTSVTLLFPPVVTVTEADVLIGQDAVLTCALTELSVQLTIEWWDDQNQLTTNAGISLSHRNRNRSGDGFSKVLILASFFPGSQ